MKHWMNLNKLFIILSLFSCLKTTEQIEMSQEESFEEKQTLAKKTQSQIILTNLLTKHKELEEQIMLIQGKVDEINYNRSQKNTSQQDPKTQLVQSEQVKNLEEKVLNLESELKTQREFIKKVTESLIQIKKSLK